MNTSYKIDVRFKVVKNLLVDESSSEKFRNLLRESSRKDFRLSHYLDGNLIDVLVLLKDKCLYEHWMKKVIENIHGYNFNTANTAVSVFKSIEKEHWYDMVNNDLKISLVKILYMRVRKIVSIILMIVAR